MNDREMEAWLKKIPVLTELRDENERELQELLGGKGLTALLGLLFGSRQALYAQLSYQPIGTGELDWRAAVLQGKIQGLELVVQTIKDLGVTTKGDGSTEEPR